MPPLKPTASADDNPLPPASMVASDENRGEATSEHLTHLVHSSIKRFRQQERIITFGTIGIGILTVFTIVLFGLLHQYQHQQPQLPANVSAPVTFGLTSKPTPDAIASTIASPSASATVALVTSTPIPHPRPTPTTVPISTQSVVPSPTTVPPCGTTVLDRSSWIASASLSASEDPPSNAIDSNLITYWGTGDSQVSGTWFQIDLGAPQQFCTVTLRNNTGATIDDYPRTYQLFVSNDGTNWGTPIAAGNGNSNITTINFPSQVIRYVRIVETANESPYWWSIDEINLYR